MNFQFAHYNYNVMDLDKSIKFYEEALGLKEVRRKKPRTEVLFWHILAMARPDLNWSLPG